MSAGALRQAVCGIIQAGLGLSSSQCGMEDTARPSASCPKELYISVHPGSWRSRHLDYGLDEEFGVKVTVSYRGSQFQLDKWGDHILGVADGIEVVARKIIPLIHCRYEVTHAANAILGGNSSGFINGTYLRLAGEQEPPVDRQPSWWGGRVSVQSINTYIGMSLTMNFDGARRVQQISEME